MINPKLKRRFNQQFRDIVYDVKPKTGDLIVCFVYKSSNTKILARVLIPQPLTIKCLTGYYKGKEGYIGSGNVIKVVNRFYPEYYL